MNTTFSETTRQAQSGKKIPNYKRGLKCSWSVQEVSDDTSWIYKFNDEQSQEIHKAVKAAWVDGKKLIDYVKEDFNFNDSLKIFADAFKEVRDGRGMALIKNLPRVGVSAEEFELLTWAIGLYFGVARPQDKNTSYINKVKDAGGVYRSPTGRGYSTSAELDFHVDGSDVVLLSCYNQAPMGGMSMCTSSIKAFEIIETERPDLAAALHSEYPFSKNGEQPEGQEGWFLAPLAAVQDGRLFFAWNRNRLENALKIEGVAPITLLQREAVDYLDEVVRRKDIMFCMHLEPGDLQLLSNQTMLHSRTSFEDHLDEDKKRTLYRLWLATPDSRKLPDAWIHHYGTTEGGAVRGGSKGHHYNDECRAFDARQAKSLGMRFMG